MITAHEWRKPAYIMAIRHITFVIKIKDPDATHLHTQLPQESSIWRIKLCLCVIAPSAANTPAQA